MPGRTIWTTVERDGHPVNGVDVDAYLASRFVTPPEEGEAPPAGAPDVAAVKSGKRHGGEGAVRLECPTDAAYYVHAVVQGVDTWEYQEVTTGPPGAPGEPGEQGPPGEPGPSGDPYVHDQPTAALTWHVHHALGLRPGGVVAVDTTDREIVGAIKYQGNNDLDIEFDALCSGKAYIS